MSELSLPDLIGRKTEPQVFEYSWKDVVLYALGVGARADQLSNIYEGAAGGLEVLPSYCVIPEMGAMGDLEDSFDKTRMLHGEQLIRLFKPIPPGGKLILQGEVKNIYDKLKAAVIHSGVTARTEDGEKVFETTKVGFYRGGGGFGGDPGPKTERLDPPEGVEPSFSVAYAIPIDQAALYRLNGDYNPLHIDPEFAKLGGFDRPILHGLCTHGYATRAILEGACGGRASALREFKARFSDVVYPGDTLTTRGWRENDSRYVIQVSTERGVVISSAYAIVDGV